MKRISAALLVFSIVVVAHAQTYTWVVTNTNTWNGAGNWSAGGPPTSTTDALVTGSTAGTMYVSTSTANGANYSASVDNL